VSDEDFDSIFDDAPAEPTNCQGLGHTGCGVCDVCTSSPAEPAKRTGRPRTRDIYPEVKAANEVVEQELRDFYNSREGRRRISAASTGRYDLFTEKDFYQPVPVSFLSKVLRINAETVRKRLETVTPVAHAGVSQNRPMYDFASVVPHLVKSKMNLRTYLRSLNPADMPQNISKVFWEAERIRTKALVEAGEAWPTESVLQVMSQANKMVNDRIPLLIEAMREEGLSDDQMKKLEAACDQFRNDVHEAYVEFPKQQSTPPHLANVAVGVEDE